jgi:enolase
MPNSNKLFIREVLLSTGELTKEAVIRYNDHEYYDSAPFGITIGLKETQSKITKNKDFHTDLNLNKNIISLSQAEFDKKISKKFNSQTSTAFSLAYLKILAHKNGFTEKEIFKYVSQKYKKRLSSPKIICNILNGGKHTYNDLAFCEFMIIPRGICTKQNIKIVSEVYLDLKSIIKDELAKAICF